MKDHFRIGILQMRSLGRDVEQNTAIVLREMEHAAADGTDILLLPECFLNGYTLPIRNEEALDCFDPVIERLCRKAQEMVVGLVATALTKGTKKPRNSAIVIDKHGTVQMIYHKVHTCDFADEACLESGDCFFVCDFEGVQLGVMICYDREYPESARVLMMKGAELILVPNDCCSMRPRLQAMSTRAYENMVGVAMANPPGPDAGQSCAFSPVCWDENGVCVDNTLLLTGREESGLFYADFDLNALRAYRRGEMMGNTFRKVKAYAALMDSDVREPFVRDRGLC